MLSELEPSEYLASALAHSFPSADLVHKSLSSKLDRILASLRSCSTPNSSSKRAHKKPLSVSYQTKSQLVLDQLELLTNRGKFRLCSTPHECMLFEVDEVYLLFLDNLFSVISHQSDSSVGSSLQSNLHLRLMHTFSNQPPRAPLLSPFCSLPQSTDTDTSALPWQRASQLLSSLDQWAHLSLPCTFSTVEHSSSSQVSSIRKHGLVTSGKLPCNSPGHICVKLSLPFLVNCLQATEEQIIKKSPSLGSCDVSSPLENNREEESEGLADMEAQADVSNTTIAEETLIDHSQMEDEKPFMQVVEQTDQKLLTDCGDTVNMEQTVLRDASSDMLVSDRATHHKDSIDTMASSSFCSVTLPVVSDVSDMSETTNPGLAEVPAEDSSWPSVSSTTLVASPARESDSDEGASVGEQEQSNNIDPDSLEEEQLPQPNELINTQLEPVTVTTPTGGAEQYSRPPGVCSGPQCDTNTHDSVLVQVQEESSSPVDVDPNEASTATSSLSQPPVRPCTVQFIKCLILSSSNSCCVSLIWRH